MVVLSLIITILLSKLPNPESVDSYDDAFVTKLLGEMMVPFPVGPNLFGFKIGTGSTLIFSICSFSQPQVVPMFAFNLFIP